MSDTAQLVELLRLQIQQQQEQIQHQQKHTEQLVSTLQSMGVGKAATSAPPAMPTFRSFDSTAELFSDYWARFTAFAGAHSIPSEKKAQSFLSASRR